VDHGESYYTLSYAPSNAKFDGSEPPRRGEAGEARRIQAYYRTGYYAVSDEGVQEEHKREVLQARFIAQKATDTLYANIEHGAPMLHDLLFSAHVAAAGEPSMATAEQMQALKTRPSTSRPNKKHPQKALAPIKLQKYVIDYGVIDPQLKAAEARKENPSRWSSRRPPITTTGSC